MYLSSISNRLLLHDCNSWSLRHSHLSYDDLIRNIHWSDDGKYMLQVNPKGLIEILTANESEVRSLQHIPTRDTSAGCFHRDGHRHVALGTKEGQVFVWDTRQKAIIKTFPIPANPNRVNFVSYNSKNTHLASSMQNGESIIYGLTTNNILQTVKIPGSNSISAMKFHPDCWSYLGLASDESHLLINDITTGKEKALFKNDHTSPVSDFAFSLVNRDVVVSVGLDKAFVIYDIRMENKVSKVRTAYPLTSVDINIDNVLAMGSRKGPIIVYDLKDLACPVTIINDHTNEVRRLSFQPLKKRMSHESSIKEDSVKSSPKNFRSPISPNLPDIFDVCPSPSSKEQSKLSIKNKTAHDDSFLCMMGLDNSNNHTSSSNENGDVTYNNSKLEQITFNGVQSTPWIKDQSTTKASTPLNNKVNGVMPSPILPQQIIKSDQQLVNGINSSNLHSELKDLVQMAMSDVIDDNRKCYYNIMLVLTKQKLHFEDEMSALTKKLNSMQETQDRLVEQNRKLLIEVEYLKATSKYQ